MGAPSAGSPPPLISGLYVNSQEFSLIFKNNFTAAYARKCPEFAHFSFFEQLVPVVRSQSRLEIEGIGPIRQSADYIMLLIGKKSRFRSM